MNRLPGRYITVTVPDAYLPPMVDRRRGQMARALNPAFGAVIALKAQLAAVIWLDGNDPEGLAS